MITTNEKVNIFNEILPFGLMYENDEQRSILFFEANSYYFLPFALKQDFETEIDFRIAVKVLHRKNVMSFLLKAMGFNKNEFLNFLEEQFYLCKNKNEACVSIWLESLYHFLLKEENVFMFQEGLNEKRGAFLLWHNQKIKELKKNLLFKKNNLFDFIDNVKNKESFAMELKESFKIEINTDIATVIHLLEKNEILVYTVFADIYRELKMYFGREIGVQQTVNDAVKRLKAGRLTRSQSFDTINQKVNDLINKHKK